MREIVADPTENKKPAKQKKEKKDKRPSTEELFWQVKDAVDHSPHTLMPHFPHHFQVYTADINTRICIEVDPSGVCRAVGTAYFASCVADYLGKTLVPHHPQWIWTAKRLEDFARFWLLNAEPTEMPRSWAFKSEPGKAFVRLPWDPEPGVETPTWDGFLSRMSNAGAFMAFVGSLFVECSDRQQYLWLYGEGNDGKGSLFRFLHRCFGSAFGNEYVPERNDSRFWTSGLLHKRVVVFPDCNNYGFVTTGLFKSLTGGDPVRIERKNESPYTTDIDAKFIFGSNEKPRISGAKSDMRRLIYCELKSWAGDQDASFERRLWEEGGAFIAKCLLAYETAAPQHGIISTDVEVLHLLSTHTEEDLEAASELYDFSSNYSCSATEFFNLIKGHMRHNRIGDFKKYVERIHGVEKRRSTSGEREWRYFGIKPKTFYSGPLHRD